MDLSPISENFAKVLHFTAGERSRAIPLVLDSPHSGTEFDADFPLAASPAALATSWDAYVDQLFGAAPDFGAALLSARFPRWLVDVNRARDDLDPQLIHGEMRSPMRPGSKSAAGMGVLRQYALPGVPVHPRPLSADSVEILLTRYWDAYHCCLRNALDQLHAIHGAVWHVNCHSMKSVGNAMNNDQGQARPDMVISDRHGKTSAPEFVALIVNTLREFGYTVQVNDPYVGAELISAYSNPLLKRHSVQIEIKRSLYMNEATQEKNAGFVPLQEHLSRLIAAIADFIRGN